MIGQNITQVQRPPAKHQIKGSTFDAQTNTIEYHLPAKHLEGPCTDAEIKRIREAKRMQQGRPTRQEREGYDTVKRLLIEGKTRPQIIARLKGRTRLGQRNVQMICTALLRR